VSDDEIAERLYAIYTTLLGISETLHKIAAMMEKTATPTDAPLPKQWPDGMSVRAMNVIASYELDIEKVRKCGVALLYPLRNCGVETRKELMRAATGNPSWGHGRKLASPQSPPE